jgi:hypothetical protein
VLKTSFQLKITGKMMPILGKYFKIILKKGNSYIGEVMHGVVILLSSAHARFANVFLRQVLMPLQLMLRPRENC